MRLITPSSRYHASYLSYIEELGDEERYPFPLDFEHHDFTAMLARIRQFEQGINLPVGVVPSSTYWLVKSHEIIGVANLRHQLNEQLKQAGGHIGLGIRPSFRGRKLSIQLLKLTLKQAANKGIKAVHVHCYRDNLASARMIVAAGGQLDSELSSTAGQVVQRYIIKQY